ncbi:DNA polymerase alpha/epsilon, subunit B [Cynara cardunculus var. scolymus]|uniref:DNA polymerase II subunit 2 n=1 Tax=Cynara cardunculus var. scolymus TaxID=59895 RepID=A0A103YEY7_CYNCS|nr:DNA polymerase alpha/epsilon, subunit B [Cynara cardunculus var. scolymus]
MSGTMRNKVQRKCKMRGYTLKVEALNEILSFLSNYEDAEDEALDLLLDELQHQSLKSSILDKEPVQRVVSLLCEAGSAAEDNLSTSTTSSFSVIDAFLIPKFRYDPIRKMFCEHTGRLPIHGDAPAKAWLYRDRFLLLSQRLSRIPQFSSPSFNTELSEFGSCQISQIQSLVGRTGISWVMGVISQLEDGHFYLEDLTAAVEINLYKITTGYFSENTIVLAQGEMMLDGTFQVQTFGFPPLEDREKSASMFTGLDYFGGGTLPKEDTTMAKLETVLDGYEDVEVVPSLFVLMGNFCSHPFNLSYNSFSSPSTVLPRCALPKYITEELQKHIPNAIFASNPCRIKFYTQEIVFFRQDLLYRMRRSCLIPPSTEETSDPFEHLVATITHQSHLCPLPLSVQPIIWNYDHCLHLYPTPHTIVLGDNSEQKAFKYTDITCFNPGSFSNDSTFVVYRPCNREVELSALDA